MMLTPVMMHPWMKLMLLMLMMSMFIIMIMMILLMMIMIITMVWPGPDSTGTFQFVGPVSGPVQNGPARDIPNAYNTPSPAGGMRIF